jgi:hypothetical protein
LVVSNRVKQSIEILYILYIILVVAMEFRIIVVLLLLIAEVVPERERSGGPYRCCNLDFAATLGNCSTDNPRIQISKDMNGYQLRLCPSEQCSMADINMRFNWIRCRDICDACQALLGPTREKINTA